MNKNIIKENADIFNKISVLKKQIQKIFVGNEKIVDNILTGFLSGLNILIEDIPGVGKTTLAKTLAKSVNLDFARIQFTPDLIPGDIIGMTIWSIEKKEFVFKSGAVMHQFILADEINRANPRTQSSLLEAMQENSITVDGKTFLLPQPFTVVATQNPSTFSGTFNLPEAQIDRFGISFSIGYPDEIDEIQILERFKEDNPLDKLKPVMQPDDIIRIRKLVRTIYIDIKLKKYIIKIANKTRKSELLKLGMSPRSCQHLLLAAQTRAFMSKRNFIIPEDIISNAVIVLQHRLILTPQARMEYDSSAEVIEKIINQLNVPTGLTG